jgi:single-strand DNA-binding protein
MGRVGGEIKITYFQGGGCVGRFSLATSESYVDKNTGQKVDKTQWHNIVARNKYAETMQKYVKKGDLFYVQGKVEYRTYNDQDGVEKNIAEVYVSDFTFLPNKREEQPQQQPNTTPMDLDANTPKVDESLNDLPF